jgi:glycosyltransferase involved in cell wall biosynthesis
LNVDTDFWRPPQLPEEALVVAPGLEHRDHSTLVAAVADLPVTVLVTASSAHSAGAGGDSRHLAAELQCRGLRYTDLPEAYGRSQLVAVPLLPADLPAGVTTVLDAMACGKALVVSATEGRPEVLKDGENCRLVRPGSRGATGRRPASPANPGERRRLGNNALIAARRHNLHSYTARVVPYRSAFSKRSRPGTPPTCTWLKAWM